MLPAMLRSCRSNLLAESFVDTIHKDQPREHSVAVSLNGPAIVVTLLLKGEYSIGGMISISSSSESILAAEVSGLDGLKCIEDGLVKGFRLCVLERGGT